MDEMKALELDIIKMKDELTKTKKNMMVTLASLGREKEYALVETADTPLNLEKIKINLNYQKDKRETKKEFETRIEELENDIFVAERDLERMRKKDREYQREINKEKNSRKLEMEILKFEDTEDSKRHSGEFLVEDLDPKKNIIPIEKHLDNEKEYVNKLVKPIEIINEAINYTIVTKPDLALEYKLYKKKLPLDYNIIANEIPQLCLDEITMPFALLFREYFYGSDRLRKQIEILSNRVNISDSRVDGIYTDKKDIDIFISNFLRSTEINKVISTGEMKALITPSVNKRFDNIVKFFDCINNEDLNDLSRYFLNRDFVDSKIDVPQEFEDTLSEESFQASIRRYLDDN